MTFEETYKKYKHIIHYLLKKYNIQYNYDEYAQLLLIKMWGLTKIYNSQKRTSLNSFLYSRLNFYLIDLFRMHHALPLVDALEQEVNVTSINGDYESMLVFQHFLSLLTSKEQQWLRFKFSGLKQYEIAELLNCSVSTLKNYQKRVQQKYLKFYSED
ncbi:sigma-70 family RNA polymerase sigma factor [Staphylococcus equorum]|uniref:Sigma-70 family RNA polymerase sigma factor n=1 Tax=Staphylococcus equorum TaxID=246432 RepID=A0A9X4LCC0_9STAP|nr:sigma-70 family RNA polymerase sigma factor [Staphylococcus equorum]MDG0844139.1 sigma-70 family RNA polymerase sigma factor [Staphylococcus equorum]MDG0860451.1 sigma-70 family RNA polymerase sigma factor [Staphylococcus equorum]